MRFEILDRQRHEICCWNILAVSLKFVFLIESRGAASSWLEIHKYQEIKHNSLFVVQRKNTKISSHRILNFYENVKIAKKRKKKRKINI